jgi:hypothetical protein
MSAFERRYSEDQIETAVTAYLDRGIRPQRKVLELAAAGQLQARDGRILKPFTMNRHTYADFLTRERKRRRGPMPRNALERPDDVMEGMRRRMIAVANDELTHAEKQRRGKRDPEHLRQIARLMREVAALPGPKDGRSRQPGARDQNGKMVDGASEGIAGKMLAAHRRAQTAPELPSKQETQAETEDASADASEAATTETDETTRSGPAIANLQGIAKQHEASDRAAAAMVRSIPQRHV